MLGNVFVQKYKNFKINDLYFEQFYQPYVHRSSDVHIKGFSLRMLLEKDLDHCAIFSKLVDLAYARSTFYYEDLASDLLELFQNQATLNKAKDGKLIKEISNLISLEPKEELENAYFHLMHSSKIKEEDKEGFPCLLKFIHNEDVKKEAVFDLFNTPLEIIESMFGKGVANDLEISLKDYKAQKKVSEVEKSIFFNAFMSRNRLKHHHFHHLVHFQEIQ